MGLQRIGAVEKSAAIGQLDLSDLQLEPLASDERPVITPIEQERLAWLESQRNESAPGPSDDSDRISPTIMTIDPLPMNPVEFGDRAIGIEADRAGQLDEVIQNGTADQPWHAGVSPLPKLIPRPGIRMSRIVKFCVPIGQALLRAGITGDTTCGLSAYLP